MILSSSLEHFLFFHYLIFPTELMLEIGGIKTPSSHVTWSIWQNSAFIILNSIIHIHTISIYSYLLRLLHIQSHIFLSCVHFLIRTFIHIFNKKCLEGLKVFCVTTLVQLLGLQQWARHPCCQILNRLIHWNRVIQDINIQFIWNLFNNT